MPLFQHSQPNPEPLPKRSPAQADEPHASRGIFSRSRNSPDAAPPVNGSTQPGNTASTKSSGFFGRRRSSDDDPSVVTARQRVSDAEAAEREADRALMQARAAVRDARDHVKRLEREAGEE